MKRTKFSSDELAFITDTHFGHANIINYCNRPFEFPDTKVMDELMVEAMDAADKAGMIIIHGGDFIFNDTHIKKWKPKRYKHHILVMGNHDKKAKEKQYDRYFGEIVGTEKSWKTHTTIIEIDDVKYLLSHDPQQFPGETVGNIHGHHHNNLFIDPEYHRAHHGWLFGSTRHWNPCVELTNYKTVSLEEMKKLPVPI